MTGDSGAIDDLQRPIRRSARRAVIERVSQLPLPEKQPQSHDEVSRDVCPITHAPFHCPVIIESGVTYEKEAIQRWLLTSRSCPATRRPLNMMVHLIPNRVNKGAVYGETEIFLAGALTSTDILTMLTWVEYSPLLISALITRMRMQPRLTSWRLTDAATIFPKLATIAYMHPELYATIEILFNSLITTLGSPVAVMVAMRILSDSCLLMNIETTGAETCERSVQIFRRVANELAERAASPPDATTQ